MLNRGVLNCRAHYNMPTDIYSGAHPRTSQEHPRNKASIQSRERSYSHNVIVCFFYWTCLGVVLGLALYQHETQYSETFFDRPPVLNILKDIFLARPTFQCNEPITKAPFFTFGQWGSLSRQGQL